jgi:hypothetical protein
MKGVPVQIWNKVLVDSADLNQVFKLGIFVDILFYMLVQTIFWWNDVFVALSWCPSALVFHLIGRQ